MKRVMFMCCLVVWVSQAFGSNRIDSIKTREDVIKLYSEYRNGDRCYGCWNVFQEQGNGEPHDKYRSDTFYKVDLDHNGRTDLIIDGGVLAVVMDMGGSFEYHVLDGLWPKVYTLKGIATWNDSALIILTDKRVRMNNNHSRDTVTDDTLVYRSHYLVEYNAHPNVGALNKISYSMADCIVGDSCSGYDLTIDRRGNAQLLTKIVNDSEKAFFRVLDDDSFQELWSLLDYVDVGSLDDEYVVSWSDANGSTTTFYYADNSKIVGDTGRLGTFGLRRLYYLMDRIRKSEHWERKLK